jgi:hypothetical protein
MDMKKRREFYELIERHYWCVLGRDRKPRLATRYDFCGGCLELEGILEGEYPEFKKPLFYKLKMSEENSFALFLLKEKFRLDLDEPDDKSIQKIEKATKECPFLKNRYADGTGRIKKATVRKFLSRMREYRGRGYLYVLLKVNPSKPGTKPFKPEAELEAIIPNKCIMGPSRTFARLEANIKERISRGEKPSKKILRKLQQIHKLPEYEGIKVSDEIADIWKSIEDEWRGPEEPLKGLTPQQIEALRKLESLSDSRPLRKAYKPIYERRFKNSPRDWRTLPEGAVLDFLKPYYSDPLALLNQGRVLETSSASYRVAPAQKEEIFSARLF